MAKTLTIRLDDKEAKELERLLSVRSENTASKLIKSLIMNRKEDFDMFVNANEKNAELENKLEILEDKIASARFAAAELLSKTE